MTTPKPKLKVPAPAPHGETGALTVKPPVNLDARSSGFVTTTSYAPAAAFAKLKLQVIWLEETTATLEALMMLVPRSRLTVAPETKLVPARLVILTVVF